MGTTPQAQVQFFKGPAKQHMLTSSGVVTEERILSTVFNTNQNAHKPQLGKWIPVTYLASSFKLSLNFDAAERTLKGSESSLMSNASANLLKMTEKASVKERGEGKYKVFLSFF